jgi:hypothetical protein
MKLIAVTILLLIFVLRSRSMHCRLHHAKSSLELLL